MEIRESILKWIAHLTENRPELSNFPICPYAKQAIISQKFDIKPASYDSIEAELTTCDLTRYQVIIYYYEAYEQYTIEELRDKTAELNEKVRQRDMIVLENEPRRSFKLNGIATPFQGCYLWVVQQLSDLNEKSTQLAKTKYYDNWTEEQLEEVVRWRFRKDL